MIVTIWLAMVLQIVQSQKTGLIPLFDKGVTFEHFLSDTQFLPQRNVWIRNTLQAQTPRQLIERFKSVGADMKILAVAEITCTDSAHILPYLSDLALKAGVELRIVNRGLG